MALKFLRWVSGLLGEGFYLRVHACKFECYSGERAASTLTLDFAYGGDGGDGGDDSIQRFKCIQVVWKPLGREELGTAVPRV